MVLMEQELWQKKFGHGTLIGWSDGSRWNQGQRFLLAKVRDGSSKFRWLVRSNGWSTRQ